MVSREPLKPQPRKPTPKPTPRYFGPENGPTLDELEKGLRWKSTEIGPALENQAESFYRVAKQVAIANAERDALKLQLAQEEARVANEFRDTASNEKGKAPTVAEIEQRAILDPKVMQLSQALNEATAQATQLAALREAYVQRSYAIKDHIMLQQEARSHVNPEAELNRRAMQEKRAAFEQQSRRT